MPVVATRCSGPTANRAVIERQVEQVFNRGNIDLIDELMSSDMVMHDATPAITPNRDGYKQLVRNHRSAFSDFHCRNEAMVAEGDMVVNRWSWSDTHDKGPYMGIAPTGRPVTMTGISMRRFEDGRIVEQWHRVDMRGLMKQLGVAP